MRKSKKPRMTLKRELQIYRDLLTDLYILRNITYDIPQINHLLSYIDKLGRAHTCGNGEIDNDKLVKTILANMETTPWKKSSRKSGINTRFKEEYKKHCLERKNEKRRTAS